MSQKKLIGFTLVLLAFCKCGLFLPNNNDQLFYKPKETGGTDLTPTTNKQPNIVILLVDDLGIGDVGCFGNSTIRTPKIDQLARDGMKMEHNLAPESLCTPSRAAFLTGRYAIRSGLASEKGYIRVFTQTAIQGGLPPDETTFAKVLQENGYKTAFIGKWHLGISCNTSNDFCHHPNNHGFNHFYGLPVTNQRECSDDWGAAFTNVDRNIKIISTSLFVMIPVLYSLVKKQMRLGIVLALIANIALWYFHVPLIFKAITRHRFGCILMRNKEVVEQPVLLKNLTHRFTTDAVNFIQESKQGPFLLMMSFAKVHTTLFTLDYFANKSKHGRYGDNVEEMDWAVGKILQKLDQLGLENNTFVYFTSDHGPDLEEIDRNGEFCGGFQGKFKGGKGTSWEGGIRVPTVARWPGKISPGKIISMPTSGLDIFPTILKITNSSFTEDRLLDGKDISGLLLGSKSSANEISSKQSRFIFHYCAKVLQAVTYSDVVRSKIWKLHFVTPNFTPGSERCFVRGELCPCDGKDVTFHEPPLVYELNADPEEKMSVSVQRVQNQTLKDVVQEALAALRKHRSSIDQVPNQLKMITFLPWMQLCCNWPFCRCEENFPLELIPIT